MYSGRPAKVPFPRRAHVAAATTAGITRQPFAGSQEKESDLHK